MGFYMCKDGAVMEVPDLWLSAHVWENLECTQMCHRSLPGPIGWTEPFSTFAHALDFKDGGARERGEASIMRTEVAL